MSTLHLVSTPIGNLGDLSLRAREVLASVDVVLAEDTRRTRILLDHIGVRVPLVSLHAHNEAARIEGVLARLAEGESVALVSDAGTPLLSDPGDRLVPAVIEAGHAVVPIPGASAVLAALVVSGLPAVPFAFLGFAPRKGRERTAFLTRVAESAETVVVYESPQRTRALLEALRDACGGGRRAAVARELTKLHEEVRRGTLEELIGALGDEIPRGEIVLVVAARGEDDRGTEEPGGDGTREEEIHAMLEQLLAEGLSRGRAAREVARRLGVRKSVVWERAHAEAPESKGGASRVP